VHDALPEATVDSAIFSQPQQQSTLHPTIVRKVLIKTLSSLLNGTTVHKQSKKVDGV